MRRVSELEKRYNEEKAQKKASIKAIENKHKRRWKWFCFVATYPFVWAWYNFRDWRTFLIFIIVMLVVGCEVWVPLLLGIIFNNAWLLGIAGTCEVFWLLPGTPFLPLCIVITIGIKALFNKIKEHRK